MLDMDRLSHTFSFAFLAPLFELSDICVELVNVFYERFDCLTLRLVLIIWVYLSFKS